MKNENVGLVSLLLVTVAMTNFAPDLIGSFYTGHEVPAAKAWQLVLRGLQAGVLFLVVWALIPWRPLTRRLAGSLACGWGALESFQVPVCRLAFDMTRPPSADTKLYSGLCDMVTGVPVYMLTLVIVLLIFAATAHRT